MTEDYSIVGLQEDGFLPFCHCLEDWSDEMADSGTLKCEWISRMKDRGLGVLMARNNSGEYLGMIQYFPAEFSPVDAPDHYHIHCCWVHAYKGKGVGDHRGRGIGSALLAAAETDIQSRGASGITAWGLSIPVWMRASWYRKKGYRRVDSDRMMSLMWKPLRDNAVKPQWRQVSPELSQPSIGPPLRIRSLVGGCCPSSNIVQERVRRIATEYGSRVNYEREVLTEADEVARLGLTDGLFIDGKAFGLGPPISESKLRKVIDRTVRRVEKRGSRPEEAARL